MTLLLPAIIFAVGCAKETQPDAQLVFNLRDPRFAEFPAEATLKAIGSISESADGPVTVGFSIDSGMRIFVFSTTEIHSRRGISIELPLFQLNFDHITYFGEEVTLDEAKRRIKAYAEAARLTQSQPVLSVRASSGAKNSTLGILLDLLYAENIIHLITEPGEPTVVANPHPLRVGKPYEIRPSDLFPTGAP